MQWSCRIDTPSFPSLRGSEDHIYLTLLNIKEACVDSIPDKRSKIEAWCPPHCDTLKFNIDGSARGSLGPAGIGGVLRDRSGKVIILFSVFIGINESNAAEIMAIRKVCEICTSKGDLTDRKVLIASDSKVVMSSVINEDFGSLKHVNIIYEIQSMLRSLINIEVVYNSRSTNSFTDMLAKKGSSKSGDFVVWSDSWGSVYDDLCSALFFGVHSLLLPFPKFVPKGETFGIATALQLQVFQEGS
ncbi:hypothetical protein Ddye_014543 [Dipteronia dyeriana]|uniref:RNase H type-1 domain-containing protein n=1 Tax=Dipteronia dyeriana TaxID=168575 RepID=A0AAE0CKN6_9ROSI|nr:hypothetical protein Ddye_014543 [Dipteronia dyeriana]